MKARYRKNEHRRRLRRYGLTEEQYQALLLKCAGRCVLCGLDFEVAKGIAAIDHCHKTGVVRGVLCGSCNMSLHKLEDDFTWAERAIAYLKSYQ
jgi:hypothetical protein